MCVCVGTYVFLIFVSSVSMSPSLTLSLLLQHCAPRFNDANILSSVNYLIPAALAQEQITAARHQRREQ